MGYKIAIDGPSGAGKGFVASELSKKLNILNIDTGAMYRAFGLYCKKNNVDIQNEIAVKKALTEAHIDFKFIDTEIKTYLNNEDVSSTIRTEEVGVLASKISQLPCVRINMVDRQRIIAGNNNVVMEGRDIGSVVFPDAELKIYLTALPEERGKRRYKDLLLKDKEITLEEVIEDVKKRDYADMHREMSPLKKTEDMIEVDSTNLNREQVVQAIMKLVKEKGLV